MTRRVFYVAIGLFSFIFGCGQKNSLNKKEAELIDKLKFKVDLITELKDLTKAELKQLPAIDEETGDVLSDRFFNGVFTEATEERAIDYVTKLKKRFRENGYLIFVFEGEDYKMGVAVINGTDDLDILRYRRTDGINYGLENEDVVKKMSEWKAKYGLIVIGCSRDWLQVEFDKLPADMDAFAQEVFEFCPDSVEQGVGTIEKLKEVISEMKGIWLWWD